jgi:TonB-linked SusC/RagA family outer membrane protein
MQKKYTIKKIFLTFMKISLTQVAIWFAFANMAFAHDITAQELLNQQVSISLDNKDIKTALAKIEKLAGVKFMYNSQSVKTNRRVSLQVDNQRLEDVLKTLFLPVKVEYEVVGKQIILRRMYEKGFYEEFNTPIAIEVTGKVTDENGNGLPGVNISLKGTSLGTSSGADGTYSINIPDGNEKGTLVFSFIGYQTSETPINNQSVINVSMIPDIQSLNEVVVTALGISKEAKKIGYAVTTVNGDQMNKARETNLALSLSGQVAGLNVHGSSGGPGSSARILLRGLPSMTGGSPLFVINGVPMTNTQRGSSGEWGGADNGDGIGNLNPDDIETMTVLKGQSASALYGSRASNGVIMITTKSGKKGSISLEYNTNYSVDRAIDFTDFQYVYGQGANGNKPANASDAQNTSRLSWGAKLDGSQVIQFDGKTYAYSAQKDNIKNFYRNGTNFTNTVSVSGGNEKGAFRLSLSNLDNQSIVRNSGLTRKTINLNADYNLTSKLSVKVAANYIDQQDKNKPQLSDGPMNANNGLFLASNIDENLLKPGTDASGNELVAFDDIYVTNPWFVVNKYINNLSRRRLIGSITARYDFAKWLYLQARTGYDISHDKTFKVEPSGTAYTQDKKGNLQELSTTEAFELNTDILLGTNKKIGEDITLDFAIGANLRKNQYEIVGISGGPFVLPNFYSYSNVLNYNRNYDFWKKEVHSAYYTLDLAYKGFLTLTTTGRYDTYSTLPSSNREIFTPSVTGSFIFSDLVNVPNLSFGKFRASYAQTSGEPEDPYKTNVYYNIGSAINGIPTGSFGSGLPNLFLKPFTVNELEFGTELKFFNNRLGLDISYFVRKTKNEIMNASYGSASGFTSGFVGTGSTQNKGLEVLVTGTPVTNEKFTWNVSFNLTSVKNKILETDANGSTINLGTYRPLNANTAFVKGMSGPQVMAYDFLRNASGNIIVDAAGLPQRGELKAQGSVLPTLYGGFKNDFNYKGVNLSFLIDYNYGNKILSATNHYSVFRGLNQSTLEGRETGIKTGVLADGSANTVTASAQAYYQALVTNVSSQNVLSGDYIKLRQLTLGYTFDMDKLVKQPVFKSIQFSFVARNLLTLMKKSDNIDPEAGFSNLVRYAGIEGTSLPSTRNYGFNLNFKFK